MLSWVGILVRHLGLAVDDGLPVGGSTNAHSICECPARYRRQMIRVAAVAVAAIESFDRKVESYQEIPEHPIDTPIPNSVPAETIKWWQEQADRSQKVLLLVSKRPVGSNAEGPCGSYVVQEQHASPWELANYEHRLIPGPEDA